jgi:LysM repeat protein
MMSADWGRKWSIELMLRTGLIALTGALLLVGCNLTTEAPTPTLSQQVLSCEAIVSEAIETADVVCDSLGQNEACYGNTLVEAEPRGETSLSFNSPGDTADLANISSLSASAINQSSGVWGVAVLRAQANIPDTLPGQSVTFLLFGDTSLSEITPQMNAVVLSTSVIGEATCAEAPPSALLMQSPEGIPVTMNFNGAEIRLGSTLYLTAIENGEMTVGVAEGSATVSAMGVSRVVPANNQVRLELGTDDGLHVVGPPSEPEAFNLNLVARAMLTLLETTPPTPSTPQTAAPTATTSPTRQPLPTQVGCTPRSDWTAFYIVQQGDTLSSIAQLYGVTVSQMQQANCLANPNNIIIGLPLRVPFVRVTNTPRPTFTPSYTPTPPATFTPTTPPKLTDTPVPVPLPTDTPDQSSR